MPDEGLHIPVPVPQDPSGEKEKEKVSATVDPTIELVLQQSFSKSHQIGLQAADRASAGNDTVAELTRNIFLKEVQQVSTREAAAMQRMDTDKLSEKILDARAAAGQPQFAPAGGSTAGAGAAGAK